MRKRLILAVLLGPVAAGAQQATPTQKEMAAELSAEMAECSVYYTIGQACVAAAGQQKTPYQAQFMAKKLYHAAEFFNTVAGLLPATLTAHMRLNTDQMMTRIANNCGNFAILIDAYANKCLLLAEHPDVRGAEIRRQKSQ